MQVNPYQFKSKQWYHWTHEEAKAMHDVFIRWVEPRLKDIRSVAEVGCGLHRFYADWFCSRGLSYCGIDHDTEVCDKRGKGMRMLESVCCCDWLVAEHGRISPDLVFSRATIDHVSDPDEFLRRAIVKANRFVYLMTYRPYDATLSEHHIEKGPYGYYYNDLSPRRIAAVIEEFHPKRYEVHRILTGRPEPEIQTELHIEVEV